MKPLIVGEAPSKKEFTERPIEGRVGARLAACCGLPLDAFLTHFDRVNLLHVRQDTREKGFEFDAAAAAQVAHAMANTFDSRFELYEGRTVLLLGKRVATAFGAHDRYFELQHVGTKANVYVLPHPSGVNRWWNDEANQRRMVEFMHSIVNATVGARLA